MSSWYDENRQMPPNGAAPANGEEAALSRVGPQLYERIFKHCARYHAPLGVVDYSATLRARCTGSHSRACLVPARREQTRKSNGTSTLRSSMPPSSCACHAARPLTTATSATSGKRFLCADTRASLRTCARL